MYFFAYAKCWFSHDPAHICFIFLEVKDANLPHIMISYQWDCQSIMVKVKDKLRQAGYKVWMDVEHMSKYILEMIGDERKPVYVGPDVV